MRVTEDRVSSTIGTLYEAATGTGSWFSAMQVLRDLFDGSRACIGHFGPDILQGNCVASEEEVPVDPEMFGQLFCGHYLDGLQALSIGTIYRQEDLFDQSMLDHDGPWLSWLRERDMAGGLAVKLAQSGPSNFFVDIQRGPGQAPPGRAERDLLEMLTPHFIRAVGISRQLARATPLAESIYGLAAAIMVVDADLQVLGTNEGAEIVLGEAPHAIGCKNGKLALSDPRKHAVLAMLVAECCRFHHDIVPGSGGDIFVGGAPLGDGEAALVLSVAPYVAGFGLPRSASRSAVIFIREATLVPVVDWQAYLHDAFRLTRSEASLCAALASGRSLKQAAADAGLKVSTMRSRMESIFEKTGTHQQGQLVAMLMATRPLMRRPR